ncbi:DUF1573 domain-containing protein [Fulvivirga sp. M361]|uniref:DUF1573 domain-containing protein n=1 Tax=Fulvivirga sp. M361 TaxID=2594266 RepID=UPI00117A7346|nr:DUF1573 domain-containing protein [Fulvivirga sp. M361]TRX49840.1 DUF1573 domain-containing protein [Fulvivirga sp. M361]
MKTFIVFVFGVFMIYGAIAQESATTEAAANGAVITFEEDKHDFGDIYQGDKVEHVFKFENTGTEPLIITNVQTTCGCTAPAWPRDPVTPGQESEIKVVFNSTGKMGRQNKVITIVSNAVSPMNRVTIVTNVLPKKDDSN